MENSQSRSNTCLELLKRPEPLAITRDSLFPCAKKDMVGTFPKESDYDCVIDEDCDVFVGGRKVISFRKRLMPLLSEGSEANPQVWDFLRKASREVYGTQRGVVAGTEFTTHTEARLTKGQVAFFTQSAAGLITTDLDCESCRRDFMKHSVTHLQEKGKSHRDRRGVWPGMWTSPEWEAFQKRKGTGKMLKLQLAGFFTIPKQSHRGG